MRSYRSIYLAVGMAFFLSILRCGLDIEEANPPQTPLWIEKCLPAVWPERGIDAYESIGIALESAASVDREEGYFEILRSDASEEKFTIIHTEEVVSSLGDYSLIDTDVILGLKYCYLLYYYDGNGNWSENTDTLSYTLLEAVAVESFFPRFASDTIDLPVKLSWNYRYLIAMENYTLTILDKHDSCIVKELFMPGQYIGARESYTITKDNLFQRDQINGALT